MQPNDVSQGSWSKSAVISEPTVEVSVRVTHSVDVKLMEY